MLFRLLGLFCLTINFTGAVIHHHSKTVAANKETFFFHSQQHAQVVNQKQNHVNHQDEKHIRRSSAPSPPSSPSSSHLSPSVKALFQNMSIGNLAIAHADYQPMSAETPGWFYETFYNGMDCMNSGTTQNNALKNYGMLTNTCMNANTTIGNNTVPMSFFISCGKDVANFNVFANANCQQTNYMNYSSFPIMNSCMNIQTVNGNNHSIDIGCTSEGSTYPLPKGNWFQFTSTDDSSCNTTFLYKAVQNNTCFNNPYNQQSEKYSYPNYEAYNATNCTAASMLYNTTYMPNVCYQNMNMSTPLVDNFTVSNIMMGTNNKTAPRSHHNAATDPADSTAANGSYYYYYYSYNYYGDDNSIASIAPPLSFGEVKFIQVSENPTLPSITDNSVHFSIAQVLNNIDANTYKLNQNLNNGIFAQTLATCLNGIHANDVNITSIISVSSSVATNAANGGNLMSTTVTSACQITYTINIPSYAAAGYSSERVAYNYTIEQLQASLQDGVFTSQLQTIANQNNAATLTAVTASTKLVYTGYSTGNTPAPTVPISSSSSSSSSSKSSFPKGAIIGIAIGGAAFLIIFGIVFFMYCRRKNKYEAAIVPV